MKTEYYDKVHRINCLSHDMTAVYHQAAWKMGISDSVLCVLYMIYEMGDNCLLYDICSKSGLSKQTINSAVRKLEQKEIIYLQQDKGRTKRVCLTEKGRAYTDRTAALLYEAECRVFNDWSEEEFDLYLRLMKKYTDSLRIEIENIK